MRRLSLRLDVITSVRATGDHSEEFQTYLDYSLPVTIFDKQEV
jgi:hypothetical protein